jgi:hypothetical protein
MIKSIVGARGITVMGGNSSYPYVNMNNPSAGLVRYNGNNQNFEVYDGSSWMTFSGNYTTVELDSDSMILLEWVRAKRAEEDYLKKQAETNPTIRDLIDQRNEIDHKITMVRTLIKDCKVCDVQASP